MRRRCQAAPSISRGRRVKFYGDDVEALVVSLLCLKPVRSQKLDIAVLRQQLLRKQRCSQKAQGGWPESPSSYSRKRRSRTEAVCPSERNSRKRFRFRRRCAYTRNAAKAPRFSFASEDGTRKYAAYRCVLRTQEALFDAVSARNDVSDAVCELNIAYGQRGTGRLLKRPQVGRIAPAVQCTCRVHFEIAASAFKV